ncbi:MAG: TonB family protein [Pyrinomonadaceae bacterium]
MKINFPILGIVALAAALAGSAHAQSISFNYRYSFDPVSFEGVTSAAPVLEPPRIGAIEVQYHEAARRNGVEGTVKASATLAADGQMRDIAVVQDLPFGVGDAVTFALQKLRFTPAKIDGRPVPTRMHVEYIVAVVYDISDKNVAKPRIVEKPPAQYPARYLAERIKGTVTVRMLVSADGTARVEGVQSVMPKEFDKAAIEAAAKINFEPARHKKSQRAVSQIFFVEYEFKP